MSMSTERRHVRRISVGHDSQWKLPHQQYHTPSNPPSGPTTPFLTTANMASPLDLLTSPRSGQPSGGFALGPPPSATSSSFTFSTSTGGTAGPALPSASPSATAAAQASLSSSASSSSFHPAHSYASGAGDRGRTLSISKRQLNPAAIFEKLGIPASPSAGAGFIAPPSPYSPSGAAGSNSPSALLSPPSRQTTLQASPRTNYRRALENSQNEEDHLPEFDGLRMDDNTTPTVSNTDRRTSFMNTSATGPGARPTMQSMTTAIHVPSTATEGDSTLVGSVAAESSAHATQQQQQNQHQHQHQTASPLLENGKMMAIDADVLLPFADRPTEVKELLEQEERNKGLLDMLKDTFDPPRAGQQTSEGETQGDQGGKVAEDTDDSKRRWTWQELQSHLSLPRSELGDQDWIDKLKAHIYPVSQLLWERLRACLGVDVDDERGGDKYEELSGDFFEAPGFLGGENPLPPPPIATTTADGQSVNLSPRAILQQHGGTESPMTSSGRASPSPSGGNALALTGASVPSGPIISPGVTARDFATSPFIASSSSGGGAAPSPGRMHRRTSSGSSSSFRRSFAMSSISENAEEPASSNMRSNERGLVTPSDPEDTSISEAQPMPSASVLKVPTGLPGDPLARSPNLASSLDTQSVASSPLLSSSNPRPPRVELGNLLRLKGAGLDPNSFLQGSALSSASGSTIAGSIVSPSQHSFASVHPGQGGGFALSPGNVTPSSPALGSAQQDAFNGSLNIDGSGASALGLSNGTGPLTDDAGASPSMQGVLPMPKTSFSTSFNNYKAEFLNSIGSHERTQASDARHGDEYAVFESDDGESIGTSTRSTGRGPGMRFSFSNHDIRQPLAPITNSYFSSRSGAGSGSGSPSRNGNSDSPGGSYRGGPARGTGHASGGFALAGLDFNKRKKTNPAGDAMDDGGTVTPRAG